MHYVRCYIFQWFRPRGNIFLELGIKALLIRRTSISVCLHACLVTPTACALLLLFLVLIFCPSINKLLILIYGRPM
jgi:hypothetical protein